MIRWITANAKVGALVWVFVLGAVASAGAPRLFAQSKETSAPSQVQVPGDTAVEQESRERAIAEDVQVLATILSENLESAYSVPTKDATADAWYHAEKMWEFTGPLGDYVPGVGVIIQMKIPTPRTNTRSIGQERRGGQATRWEQTRRRLRGEPVNTFAKMGCAKCHSAEQSWKQEDFYMFGVFFSDYDDFIRQHTGEDRRPTINQLLDQIVSTLAENGRNMRHLQEQDRIVISLQYDAYHKINPGGVEASRIQQWLRATPNPPAVPMPSFSARRRKANQTTAELSGDLLMTQQQYTDAIAVYKNALKSAGTNYEGSQQLDWVVANQDLLRKLMHAYTAAGQQAAANQISVQLAEVPGDKQTNRAPGGKRTPDEVASRFLQQLGRPPADEEEKSNSASRGRQESESEQQVIELLAEGQRAKLADWIKAGQAPAMKLPSRIRISTPVGLLRQMGAGKISKEQFLKGIEIAQFPTRGEKESP